MVWSNTQLRSYTNFRQCILILGDFCKSTNCIKIVKEVVARVRRETSEVNDSSPSTHAFHFESIYHWWQLQSGKNQSEPTEVLAMVRCSTFRSSRMSFDTRSIDDGSVTVGAFKTSETFELLGKSKGGGCRMQPRRRDYNEEDNAVTETETEFWMKCASSYLDDLPSSLLFASKQKKPRHIISWKSKRTPQRRVKPDPSNSIAETFETTLEEYTSATSRSDTLSVEEPKEMAKKSSRKKGKVRVIPMSSMAKKKSVAIEQVAKTCSSVTISEVQKSDLSKEPSLLVLDLTAFDDKVPKIKGKNIPTIKVPSNPNTPRSTKKASTPVGGKHSQYNESIPIFIHGRALEILNSRKSRGVDPPATPATEKKEPTDKSTSKYRYGSPEKARRSRSPQKKPRRFFDLPACPSSAESNPTQEADKPTYVCTDETASTQESSDAHSSDGPSAEDHNSEPENASSKPDTTQTEKKRKPKHRSHRRSRSTSTPRGRKHKKGTSKSKKRSKSARPRETPSPIFTKHVPGTHQPANK